MKNNVKLILKDKTSCIIGILGGIFFWYLGIRFLDIDLVVGNLGHGWALAEIILHALLCILLTIFIAATAYKIRVFNSIRPIQDTSGGGIGGFLGLIVTGCSSCSITLASYIGLGALLSQLPFNGLEVKVLGVLLLARATRDTVKNLTTCKIK